jgi:peroxisomal coenzyme A diphosphatase NUDT7
MGNDNEPARRNGGSLEKGIRGMLPENPAIRGISSRRAVVMVLLAEYPEGYHVVFQERSKGIPQPGEIGFPGGMAQEETDRSPEDTALRETEEELGIPRSGIRVIGRLDSALTRTGRQIDVVVGITGIPIEEMKPNPDEVARVFSLPLAWLALQEPRRHHVVVKSHPTRIHPETGEEEVLLPAGLLALPEKYHHPWGESIHSIVAYPTPEGVIWGITGDILQDFLQKIKSLME